MRVIVLMDPSTRRTWGTPQSLVEGDPDQTRSPAAPMRRPGGQGLARRLLGRVSSWFGGCQQLPSDTWEPSARHRTLWSWWCR
jgi:hypothetical protein